MEGGGSNEVQRKRCCVICDRAEATSKEKVKCLNSSELDNYRSQLISHPIVGELRSNLNFEPEWELVVCPSCEERLNSVIVGKGMLKSMTEEAVELERSYARKLEQLKFTGKSVLSNLAEIVSSREEQQQKDISGSNNVKPSKLYFGEVIENASNEITGLLAVLERKKTAINESFTTTSPEITFAPSTSSSVPVKTSPAQQQQQQQKSCKQDPINVIATSTSEPTSTQQPVLIASSVTSLQSSEIKIETGPVFLLPKVESSTIGIESEEDGSEANQEKEDEGGAVVVVAVASDEPEIEKVVKDELPPLELDEDLDLDLSDDASIDYSKARFTEDGIQILEGTRSRPKKFGPLYKNPTGGLKIHAKNKPNSTKASTSSPSPSTMTRASTEANILNEKELHNIVDLVDLEPEETVVTCNLSSSSSSIPDSSETISTDSPLPRSNAVNKALVVVTPEQSSSNNISLSIPNEAQKRPVELVEETSNESSKPDESERPTKKLCPVVGPVSMQSSSSTAVDENEPAPSSLSAEDQEQTEGTLKLSSSATTVVCGSFLNKTSNEEIQRRPWNALPLYPKHDGRKDKSQFCFEHFLQYHNQNKFNLQTQPFGIYKLVEWEFDDAYTTECLIPLWEQFGPSVKKELQVLQCSTSKVISENFYKVIFHSTPNLQKLLLEKNNFTYFSSKSTKIARKSFADEAQKLAEGLSSKTLLEELEIIGGIPSFFRKFAEQQYPNLRNVKPCYGKSSAIYLLQKIFPIALAPFNSIKKLDLQRKIKIQPKHTKSSKSSMSYLRGDKFPSLEELSIYLGRGEEWDDDFNECLISLRGSLKKLDIYRDINEQPKGVLVGMKMTKLEELYLRGRVTDSLDFLPNIPNLKKLHVNLNLKPKDSFSSATAFRNRKFVCSENPIRKMSVLYGLKYFHIDFSLSRNDLDMLCYWAPNLQIIHCIADNSTFTTICGLWQWKLEELHLLRNSTVDDDGITGFLNIMSLKSCLKRFSLECNEGEGRLTDRSVRKGFLLLNNLEMLNIHTSANLSKAAEDLLINKISRENLKVKRS